MAPIGNNYAEKWTLERTIISLHTIERFSLDKDYLYLGQALNDAGLYDDVWRYWRRKWRKRYEILDKMKQIMQRFECRIFEKMAKKEMPERVGMFALKHHYGWGKEPVQGVIEDLSYLDQELIQEPATAPQNLPITESTPNTSHANAPEKPIHPAPIYAENDMRIKRMQYNATNRLNPIQDNYPYFDGEPPVGFSVIRFEKGYFLKG